MDESKQPGIRFVGIFLLDLTYKWHADFKANGKPVSYEIEPEYSPVLSEDEKSLEAHLTVAIKSAPLNLKVHLLGAFVVEPEANMSLKDFAGLQAIALMFPYAREVIFNITSRSPIPALALPPTNLKALFEEQKRKKATKEKPAKKKSVAKKRSGRGTKKK